MSTPNPSAPQQAQPTTTITQTSHEIAQQKQDNNRFTRAERRQFTKEKKTTTQQGKKPAGPAHQHGEIKFLDMEDLISFLAEVRDKFVPYRAGDLAKVLRNRRPAKPAPKPVDTEKAEKQREKNKARAEERKKAWEEKKATRAALAQAAEGAAAAEGSAPAAPAPVVEQQPLPDFDEINFDDF
ncbi:hypothetical protein BDV95DRAFT_595561 [Massariosphaeria phaeospora]|uniref:Uncharacterized protein n=1 Tax=Massariosphaeria phaeospora TaxID=100035 RepID=A0A7C8ICW0_9PLEO|nr:hypothetical protein BDV95DRAFT_595561 [Massariosphaeria phaeospora]